MSDQEMNQKMEFIVAQQAQFAADIQIMREVQARDAKLLKDALLGVLDIVGSLTRAQLKTDQTVNSLAEDFGRLTQAQARTEQAQARTEESLKILINVVERHISGNGGPASPS
jgi:allophanate hydrolase subunit 1